MRLRMAKNLRKFALSFGETVLDPAPCLPTITRTSSAHSLLHTINVRSPYSQSISIPSKEYWFMNAARDWANLLLFADEVMELEK